MDELTFRRTIYADPHSKDPALKEAAKQDHKKQAFWDEVKELDMQILAATKIPVPDNFADKLLLKHSMDELSQRRTKRPWYVAMAASFVIVAGLSVSMLSSPRSALASDIFAHVDEGYMNKEIMMHAGAVQASQVDQKMASFKGELTGELGEVLAANYCYLNAVKSLHLIIKGEKGLISLFVMPEKFSQQIDSSFSHAALKGTSFLLESAKIIIVGEDQSQVDKLAQVAKNGLRFSA